MSPNPDHHSEPMDTDSAAKRAIFLAAILAAFLTPFMGSASNVAMPSLGREFAMDAVLLGWVPTSYLLAAAMFLVPFGRIADIRGRKRVFTYGITVFTVAALLSALAPSAQILIGARILQGLGSAMIFGTGLAMLTSAFPRSQRGRVLGFNVAAVYTGLSIGPFVGGYLTQNLGWRSVFLLVVPMGLIALGFVLFRVRGEWAEARGEGFDLGGSILYALSLLVLMYGFSLLPDLLGVGLILVGLLGLGMFVYWEMRARFPVLNVDLFARNRVFAFSSLAALINYGATSAVTFLLSLYLQYIKALSPQQAGLVLIAQPVVMAICSPVTGRLSDRIEPRLVASTGMALTTIGLSSLIFLGAATPVWAIIACLVLLGFGFALFSSPNINAIMSSVERRYYGVASGTSGTMRLVGQMLSMGIALLLFSLYIGRVEITPQAYPAFLSSIKTAFDVFAVLCMGGIFASLARGRIREDNDKEPRQPAYT